MKKYEFTQLWFQGQKDDIVPLNYQSESFANNEDIAPVITL